MALHHQRSATDSWEQDDLLYPSRSLFFDLHHEEDKRMFHRLQTVQPRSDLSPRTTSGNQLVQDAVARQLLQGSSVRTRSKKAEPCCICLDDMKVNELIPMLLCGHRMHEDCLVRWLRGKSSCICPLCKQESAQASLMGD
eukprot:jgi/Chrzof1/7052/Cz02g09010.t1